MNQEYCFLEKTEKVEIEIKMGINKINSHLFEVLIRFYQKAFLCRLMLFCVNAGFLQHKVVSTSEVG